VRSVRYWPVAWIGAIIFEVHLKGGKVDKSAPSNRCQLSLETEMIDCPPQSTAPGKKSIKFWSYIRPITSTMRGWENSPWDGFLEKFARKLLPLRALRARGQRWYGFHPRDFWSLCLLTPDEAQNDFSQVHGSDFHTPRRSLREKKIHLRLRFLNSNRKITKKCCYRGRETGKNCCMCQ